MVISGVALLALLAGGALWMWQEGKRHRGFESADITGAEWGRGFQLTDHNGNPRTLADFRGKVVVLFFGFTHCPDVCPTTLATLAKVLQELGGKAHEVQVLMVTVDPKRDNGEVLSKYVPAFHPSFIGLHGSEEAIERVAKDFKIFYQPIPANTGGSYAVDHSTQKYAFDRAGRIRLVIHHDASVASMAKDIAVLLDER